MDNREFFNSRAFDWDRTCRHDDNKIREIIKISKIKENSKILDVGTGTGILISYLLERNPSELVGVDISENMISVAKSKYSDTRIKLVVNDIMDYSETGFDYIFLYCVFPHIYDKRALFEHLAGLLNHDGKVIIAHSQSREEINAVHKRYVPVKRHRLLPAEATSKQMNKYFNVNRIIDDNNLYYISGIRVAENPYLEAASKKAFSMA